MFLNVFTFIYIYIYLTGRDIHTTPSVCVEVREQLAGVSSPLPPRRFQIRNSGYNN